jgi:hypothetical protein
MMRSLLFLALVGCGGDTDPQLPDPIDAPPVTPDVPAACNTLGQTASPVAQLRVAEATPTPTGGAVPDGTYHLISDTVFTGVGGATGATGYSSSLTTLCSALVCEIALDDTADGDPKQTFMLTISGTTLTETQSCPETGTLQATFSTVVTGGTTTVAVYEPFQGGTRERIYEQQ